MRAGSRGAPRRKESRSQAQSCRKAQAQARGEKARCEKACGQGSHRLQLTLS